MKNLKLKASSIIMLLAATGCLETKPDDSAQSKPDPRAALVAAIDNQATTLVKGINQVIINGQFLKNMTLQNPPNPISLSDENDVNKAIQYLLSNQSTVDDSTIYHPDPRICSELLAKDHPQTCIQFMADVTLTQTALDDSTGYVEINVAGSKPLLMSYSPDGLSANSKVIEVVKTLHRVSDILVQNGEHGFADKLPTTFDGEIQLAISSKMGFSAVTASIIAALDIQGTDSGSAYGLQAQVSQNTLAVYLKPDLGLAQASVNIPKFVLTMNPHDEQNLIHQVQIQFPGATGTLSLDNSIATMALQALRLNSSDIYIDVDGQNAVHGISSEELDASIQVAPGGDGKLTFAQQFSAQAIFSSNPLISKTGTISASVDQGTQIIFSHTAQQGKVIAGSINLLGTLDFAGSLNASAGTCLEGQKAAPLYLQSVICKF